MSAASNDSNNALLQGISQFDDATYGPYADGRFDSDEETLDTSGSVNTSHAVGIDNVVISLLANPCLFYFNF